MNPLKLDVVLKVTVNLSIFTSMIFIEEILKHLRQFVQSDWFLPVFISHDRDTASGAPDYYFHTESNSFVF